MKRESPSIEFGRQKLFGATALFCLLSALGLEALSRLIGAQGRALFWQEFSIGDGPVAWLMLVLVVMAVPLLRLTQRWPWAQTGKWLEQHIAVVCGLSAVFYAFLTKFASFGVAYAPDESSAVLQAQTFAMLHLTPRVAPDLVSSVIPGWLQGNILLLSTQSGRYTPTYWPGYALIMAPFARLGVEWLCNPVLTALSLALLFHLTAKVLQSREAGVWAVLLSLVSPQIALNAGAFYAMPAHLLFNLLFCWFFWQNTRRAAFYAGLIGSFALILHNPVPHLSFALPWIFWIFARRRAQIWPLLAGYALIALPVGLGWSFYLDSFHISPFVHGASVAQATKITQSSAFSQVVSRVAYVFHPPDRYLLLSRAAGLIKIGLWSSPGLITLAFIGWRRAAASVAITRRALKAKVAADSFNSRDNSDEKMNFLWLLGASVVTNFGIYCFIRFDQGHGWGFRYLHQSWFAFPMLAAWFLTQSGAKTLVFGHSARRFCAVLVVLGAGLLLPLRVVQARIFMNNVLRDRPPAAPSGPALTFVRESHGESGTFIVNDPFLRSDNWNLRFLSEAHNAQLARRYLVGARRVESGAWGEIWSGTRFLRPPSP